MPTKIKLSNIRRQFIDFVAIIRKKCLSKKLKEKKTNQQFYQLDEYFIQRYDA